MPEKQDEKAGAHGFPAPPSRGADGASTTPTDQAKAKEGDPHGEQTKPAGKKPLAGEARDVGGEIVGQVGKHPDVPADVPVQAGTALDPSLPPPDPHRAILDPKDS